MSQEVNQPAAIPVAFDEAQQRVFDAAIAAERRAGKAEVEAAKAETANIKFQAVKRIEELTGESIDTTDFLTREVAASEATQTRLAQLEHMYFGGTPEAGRRSNDLARTNIKQYRLLRAEYEALKHPHLVKAREEAEKHKSKKTFMPH